MVIEHLQAQAVADNGGLPHGNVGKGPGMHHAGLIFRRAAQRGINGVAHPRGHGPGNFQVAGGDGFTLLVISDGNFTQALT